MPIEFAVENDRTLEVFDPIMRHRAALQFSDPIDPRPTSPDEFVFPIDRAVTFHASGVHQQLPVLFGFDGDGHQLNDLQSGDSSHQLPPGEYYFSLRESIKIYLHIHATDPVTVTIGDNETLIDFGTRTQVTLGVRSLHQRPETTITTTDDPADVMAAVSMFGSALKDTGPMRSFTTLRGHPPELELGDDLHIPDILDAPDTGIRLELPPERRYAYAAAPLAYYLGAEVVPSDDPQLVTDTGQSYPLDEGWSIETELNRLLRRTFFLDTLVRQDDPFCVEYPGREAFEDQTGISLDGLYDKSPATRLDTYLDLPDSVFDRLGPNWLFGARVPAAPETVEYLPYLADILAAIQPLQGNKVSETMGDLRSSDNPISGTPLMSFEDVDNETIIEPEPTEAARQLWLGPGIPMGGEKPDIDAIRRGHDRDPVEGDIDYVVVCNDERMLEEDEEVRDVLDERAGLTFSIETHRQVTTSELRDILAQDSEVFHFVGHADEHGFVCTDGHLDATTLDTVNADVFFLNSCLSAEQGRHILDAGAVAGIVTLEEIQNSVATRIGQQVAMLLNHGVQVGGALDIATELTDDAEHYTALGNTTFQVVLSDVPGIDTLVEFDDDRAVHSYHLSSLSFLGSWVPRFRTDIPADVDMGTPIFDTPGVGCRCIHDKEEYLTQLQEENLPLWVDGELRYPSNVDFDALEL